MTIGTLDSSVAFPVKYFLKKCARLIRELCHLRRFDDHSSAKHKAPSHHSERRLTYVKIHEMCLRVLTGDSLE